MIGHLTGVVSAFRNGQVILDTNGVGYILFVPKRELEKLKVGDKAEMEVHTYVKEDALALFGFFYPKDLNIFQHLITVSGVGPKLALTILSQHSAEEIIAAISRADTAFFQSISGIGKKNSQKIIVELKSKFGSLQELNLSDEDQVTHQDLISALKSLGYSMPEIKPLLKRIPAELVTTEEQLKYTLKELK